VAKAMSLHLLGRMAPDEHDRAISASDGRPG
jgi:hypothetical protein